MEFDLIINNATIVTAAEILPPGLSIGIKNERIACISAFPLLPTSPTSSTRILDAQGAYVTPGGVDSHVHLAQDNAPTGDGFLTGTCSALAGGTTTIIAFATQKRSDESLWPVIEEYHRRSRGQSYVDYGFHLILSHPSDGILGELEEVRNQEGITSVKLYMTYPALKLSDGEMLEVLMRTRALGMTTMIHAENSDIIDMITARLLRNPANTTPAYHAIARPQIAETEATYRAISLSTLTSTPILLVHMSSPAAVNHVRKAQKKLLPIHAETCPHYLWLRSEKLGRTALDGEGGACGHRHDPKADAWEGSKYVCAPPLRHSVEDLAALWGSISNSTINVLSSDHAPSTYDHPNGKLRPLLSPSSPPNDIPIFSQIPNGLPGLETRIPLLFSAATARHLHAPFARLSLPKFVELTSTNPAKMYGLADRKGSIAPGMDADLVIWYPSSSSAPSTSTKGKEEEQASNRNNVIRNDDLHHAIDYTPFEGIEIGNWPRYVVLRGEVAYDRDAADTNSSSENADASIRPSAKPKIAKGIVGEAGRGQYLKRGKGEVIVGWDDGRMIGKKADEAERGVEDVSENGEEMARVEEMIGMKRGERALWM